MRNDDIKDVVDACLDVYDICNFVLGEIATVSSYEYLNQDELGQLNNIADSVRHNLEKVKLVEHDVKAIGKVDASNVMKVANLYVAAVDTIATVKSLNANTVSVVEAAKKRSESKK